LSRQNRLRFELISHKLMRLLVPILLLLLLTSSALLATRSMLYMSVLAVQTLFYVLAALGAGRAIPILTRITAPATAFCMLNAAVVVGFYKFLFTHGPLWKIWTSSEPASLAIDGQAGPDRFSTILSLHLHDRLRTRGVTR
jgi:biofilm PGA synthesis N-glycosyltransferase PgaC